MQVMYLRMRWTDMFNVNTVAMYKGAAPFADTGQSPGKK
jgi:hypothetical protein